jgi:transglutaminase-like putative cysteine protease
MNYRVSHKTTFDYAEPVSISHHLLHLSPRPAPHPQCRQSGLTVEPAPAVTSRSVDYFGNPTAFVIVQKPHDELSILATSEIEVSTPPPPDPKTTLPWEEVAAMVAGENAGTLLEVVDFRFPSPFTVAEQAVGDYARESFSPGRPVLEAARELTARIFEDFTYDGTATDVSTPVDQVLQDRRGVCQDFAHLQIAGLRQLGLPARYVSGYLLTRPPPGQEKLVGADASHAWLAIWCPDHGWVDLDPTNDLIPGDEHITLAWGRDYGDVSPINGVMLGGGEHEIEVAVDVRPLEG